MLGHVTFGHKNGQKTSTDYVGNFAFADTEQGPRIEKYQAWLVGLFLHLTLYLRVNQF